MTHFKSKLALAGIIAFTTAAPAAMAEEACEGFSWPLATELALIRDAQAEAVKSGGELETLSGKAIALALIPTKDIAFPVKPGVKPESLAPASYSGFFTIKALPKKALYQITLSKHAWVDAVQDGKGAETVAFTGKRECTEIRKSVRFELDRKPLTVIVAGSDAETIKVTIREAQD